jgi:uncharacterized SAM-binding protein YcdF (DUF218 family)
MTLIPTIRALTDLIFCERAPRPSDLIFVLGNDWIPTMDTAVDLYQRGLAKHLIISGRGRGVIAKSGQTEAKAFRDYAVERGIPLDTIALETRATSTLENFVYSRTLIEDTFGWTRVKRVTIVCLAFHTRRVLMTAAAQWPKGVHCYTAPVVDPRNIRKDNWWADETRRARVYQELRRIGEYGIKGDISESP